MCVCVCVGGGGGGGGGVLTSQHQCVLRGQPHGEQSTEAYNDTESHDLRTTRELGGRR